MRQFIDLMDRIAEASDAIPNAISNAETRAARTRKAIEWVTQARDLLGTSLGDEIRPTFDQLLQMLKQENLHAKQTAMQLQHHSM